MLAPGQVVDLLLGGFLHRLADLGQLGGQRLALVQRLGADLAGVVDAHQAGDMAGVFLAQFAIGFHDGRRRSRRLAAERQQGAQGGVGLQQETVDGRIVAVGGHGAPPETKDRTSLPEVR